MMSLHWEEGVKCIIRIELSFEHSRMMAPHKQNDELKNIAEARTR